ncbi:TPA: hypothetical protein HH295_14910 [Xanthomonas vasicola pv. zeae]|uniref:Uncharacterized protein n=2 Tax=Xanthomonas vasicola TaxID=56459 RepID=A0ABD7SAZ8_XANVA|nr:hypothetical protein C7V42_21690 [Xanthomonas vasicola pv. vasculorum]AZR24575.1 hypothetical protein NX81_022565 [Xanthomonas vasicola]AZR28703.1 hypothetical protein NX80_022165 [Xanthomonas vasicola pv. arecae]AZR31930.1 hypothetical protein KWO_016880 [Xanthomonas vasicola pv. musacearum NCPPB 4379]KEZ98152.1 hypothetical protein A11M_0107260 [Xanthomonas vasicola pv. vasculorum NCPPB 895]KFA11286.1 hypothetical protein KWM_0106805 [Xanthomonas vasicola pv. musacearum NCPPB 2005]KFA156
MKRLPQMRKLPWHDRGHHGRSVIFCFRRGSVLPSRAEATMLHYCPVLQPSCAMGLRIRG